MKVVIKFGGECKILRKVTDHRAKPMVPRGKRDIVFEYYYVLACNGSVVFSSCPTYKRDKFKNPFRNRLCRMSGVTLRRARRRLLDFDGGRGESDRALTLTDTGGNRMTAFRVKLIQSYLTVCEPFWRTCRGDPSTVDSNEKIASITQQRKFASPLRVWRDGSARCDGITPVRPTISGRSHDLKTSYVNGSYVVCAHRMFYRRLPDPEIMLVTKVIVPLVSKGFSTLFGIKVARGRRQPTKEGQYLEMLCCTGQAHCNEEVS